MKDFDTWFSDAGKSHSSPSIFSVPMTVSIVNVRDPTAEETSSIADYIRNSLKRARMSDSLFITGTGVKKQ